MSITDSTPNEAANPQEGGSANSPDNSQSEVISALVDRLGNIESQLNSLRSEKDKGVAKTNRRLSEFEKKQEELVTMQKYIEQSGGNLELAARNMAIDAMLIQDTPAQVPEQIPQSQPVVADGQTNQTQESNLVPLLLGPDGERDPGFVALVGTGLSPNEAAIKLAEQRQATPANPNAASGISGAVSGSAPAGSQQTVLQQEYQQRLSKIRQGDWAAIGMLKDEMRSKGLEVY